MADRNPWHDPKLPGTSGLAANPDQWMDRVHFLRDDWTDPTVSFEKMWTNAANAQPHDRDGQNVMFGDGHNSYEKRTDVGVRHDGIYTPQVSGTDIRTGGAVARAAGTFNVDVPMYSNDSLLVNDSRLP